MKFGPVALDQAVGTLLAHSLRIGGRTLRKGRVLSVEDIEHLRRAEIAEITVARLEADDIGEDEAARRIAASLAGPGISAQSPFTGRANLVAERSGLVRLDADLLRALNAVDEAVTVATLPDFDPVSPRQMVATIKIIPFAVPRPVLERCEALVQGRTALSVIAFRAKRAVLIQTTLEATKPSILDTTERVTAQRLTSLGSSLVAMSRCRHDTAALRAALDEALTHAPDLILIAGASAVVDRGDVVPAALVTAGGTVDQFGMPVDPGNLLLLGRLQSAAVIGMPGCARSPKLNGFDWVLQRLCAELPVTRAEIIDLAIGGLLKEIPSRPQPRDQSPVAEGPRAPRIAALVLAAGRSTRMGRNKLLLDWRGAPLVAHVVDRIAESAVEEIIVVTGHQAEAVQAALADRPVRFVENQHFAEGLSTSLAAGIAALPEGIDGVLVALGDMPLIRSDIVDRLMAGFSPADGRAICLPIVQGRRGNPVLWASVFLPELARITGDQGGKSVLAANPELVCEIVLEDDAVLTDIDTPEALDHLRRR